MQSDAANRRECCPTAQAPLWMDSAVCQRDMQGMPYQRAHFLLFLSKTARKTKERDGKCTRKGRTPSMEPRPRCVRQEPSLAWIHPSLGCLGNPSWGAFGNFLFPAIGNKLDTLTASLTVA